MGATWVGTTRFAQTVTDTYTMGVIAPQSVSQYGEITQNETYSLANQLDSSIWENYTAYNDTGNGNSSYYIDQNISQLELYRAIITGMNKAKTSILASHRDTKVQIEKSIFPQVDLKHTVYINTTPVVAKGKVYSIVHSMDVSTGDAATAMSISLFKSQGSSTDQSFVIPTFPADNVSPGSGTVILGNHFGEDPTVQAAQTWTGMIGNRYPASGGARTTYQEAFVVQTPPIPDALRQEYTRFTGATYSITIPNDTLTVTF